MKYCPVCKSRVFDDMDTCFNCLHHFEDERSQETQVLPIFKEGDMDDFLRSYFNFLGDYFKRVK